VSRHSMCVIEIHLDSMCVIEIHLDSMCVWRHSM